MKEITRRNFLRMATIAVLISGMGMLSSCGDEDTLKLTDFYGETRTYPITAVDDNSLELELPNGETVTYYHTAEEALKH